MISLSVCRDGELIYSAVCALGTPIPRAGESISIPPFEGVIVSVGRLLDEHGNQAITISVTPFLGHQRQQQDADAGPARSVPVG